MWIIACLLAWICFPRFVLYALLWGTLLTLMAGIAVAWVSIVMYARGLVH